MDKSNQLRDGVKAAYSQAAERPNDKHPFPVGRNFAESLGYSKALLARIPELSVDAFTGVSNVADFAEIKMGSIVLDLGCGAGLDALISAIKSGGQGKIIGMDFSDKMLSRARQSTIEMGAENVTFLKGDAENIPLKNGSIDIALINGIFNLNPARDAIFQELSRVVRVGGVAYAAEIILKKSILQQNQVCDTNWFAWIPGAKEGGAFLQEFKSVGFREAAIIRTTRNARTKNPDVLAAEVLARR